ncbi:MAG: hypothetical protein ACE5FT_01110 [Candidatus Nanoarchaeia archaeon]
MKWYYSVAVIIVAAFFASWLFNLTDHSAENPNCSYLNPPYIDYLAFLVGLFLAGDGFYHPKLKDKVLPRLALIRMFTGVCVMVIHIWQFVLK